LSLSESSCHFPIVFWSKIYHVSYQIQMHQKIFIPSSLKAAGCEVRTALNASLANITPDEFSRSWCALAYLFPNLHPDGFDELNSGWTRATAKFALEAWKRFESGELSEDILYPSDAAWCGIYDRITQHLPEDAERRQMLAFQ
jgi:hypothetical protein